MVESSEGVGMRSHLQQRYSPIRRRLRARPIPPSSRQSLMLARIALAMYLGRVIIEDLCPGTDLLRCNSRPPTMTQPTAHVWPTEPHHDHPHATHVVRQTVGGRNAAAAHVPRAWHSKTAASSDAFSFWVRVWQGVCWPTYDSTQVVWRHLGTRCLSARSD